MMQESLEARLNSIDPGEIVRELNDSGMFCMSSALPDLELRELQQAVSGLVRTRGPNSFSLIQPWKNVQAFAKLVESPAFYGLLRSLSLRGWNKECVARSEIFNVLRVITGPAADREASLVFHYDATVITALVPVFIPPGDAEQAGDFVCFPNFRPIRNFVFVNFLEKLVMQNPLTRFFFARAVRSGRSRAKIIRLIPGNIYFFWGYRTYHANFSCSPGALRATLLFHYGDPHLGSLITRSIMTVRRWRVNRTLKSNPVNASNASER